MTGISSLVVIKICATLFCKIVMAVWYSYQLSKEFVLVPGLYVCGLWMLLVSFSRWLYFCLGRSSHFPSSLFLSGL